MTEPMTQAAKRIAYHYGPPPGTAGGMASVLEAYASLPLQHHVVRVRGTWHPDTRLHGLPDALRAAVALLRDPGRADERPVCHVHLSEGGSFLREGGIATLAGWRHQPVVASLHGAEIDDFLSAHPRLARAIFRRCDAVVALGEATAATVAPFVPDPGRITVIPNPIEIPAVATPAGDNPPIAVFGGEIGRRKGVDVLLDAWRTVREAVPDAALVVAGPAGDLTCSSDATLGITCVGSRSRREVGELLDSCRVAVLPSRAEVMPMFLLEAMARARPVVSTDVGEIPSMVGELSSTILTSPGDAPALATALIEMLASPASATDAGNRLRERAIDTYGTDAVAHRLDGLYLSLV